MRALPLARTTALLALLAVASALPTAAAVVAAGPAADPLADPGWDLFRSFGSGQGLPQSTVFALAQDEDGFVYAGTGAGLARYDGRRWQRIRGPGLAGNGPVHHLAATADGALWVGNDESGLLRLRGGSQVMHDERGGIVGSEVILPAARDEVWVGTAGDLFRCDPRRCREVPAGRGLLVSALATGDGPGGSALWVGTAYDGVRRIDLGGGGPRLASWQLRREEGLPDSLVRGLAWWQGALWIGTGRGVTRLLSPRDGDRLVLYTEAIGFPRAGSFAFAASRTADGRPCLWVAQNGGGLSRFDAEGHWQHLGAHQGLPEDYFFSLLVTPGVGGTPLLWAGSANSGVVREERGRWRAWMESAGLPHRVVVGIGEVAEPGGETVRWAGTLEGAVRWAGGRWLPWLPEQLDGHVVRAAERVGEALWVATDRGLLRWDGRRATWLTSDNSPLPALIITDLETRRTARGEVELWAATNHGLARVDPRGVVPFAEHQPFDGPRALVHGGANGDGSETLWLGTGDGGLYRYDGERWQSAGVRCPCGGEVFHLLWQPATGSAPATLWVAHRSGITRVVGRECSTLGREQGIEGPVYQLAMDHQGRLYAFGHDGVTRLAIAEATAPHPHLDRYGLQDGLPDLELERAAYTDHRGRIWAGSAGGVTAFDPAEPPLRGAPGALRLLRAIHRGGRPLRRGQELASDDSDVGFEYSLLAYGAEGQVRYQTQLVGLEARPSAWRSEGVVGYSRLPPGRYRFRLRGRVGEGPLTTPVELAFTIAAPWWRSAWATILGALLLLAAGVALGRLRERALARRATDLAQQVAERTRQLAAANRQLEEAAVTDPLTGARNRRYLTSRLPEDAAAARRRVERGDGDGYLALAVVDLDHFKSVNDRFGHAVGDEVLREVAARLRDLVRVSDFLVRWGGEEFLLVARDVARESLPAIARRLLQVVAAEPVRTAIGPLSVTCSAGLVAYPLADPSQPMDAALELADEALYAAKEGGRYQAMVVLAGGERLVVLP